MHRHGYVGTKFGRERDQRRALLKSLSEALIINESIETTLPKAKAVKTYTEKLITKAKKGDLHNRRQVMSSLQTKSTAYKLVDEIAPKLSGRQSGYLRVTKTVVRQGDRAQLAKVSFVDNLSQIKTPKAAPKKTAKPTAKKVTKKTKTTAQPSIDRGATAGRQVKQAASRTGRRGNR
jgi:large subunit ribosomal protein L17